MRIVINGWFWHQPTVGSGQYLRHLLRHLRLVGPQHEYHLILPSGEDGGAQLDGVTFHVCTPPVTATYPRLHKLLFEQVTFPHACRVQRADVAHVPYWGSPLISPCPVVVTIHDLIPLLLPAYRGKWSMRWYIRLVGWTARRARAVIAVSQATGNDVARHLAIPPQRIHVVHEGVPPACRPVLGATSLEAVRRKYHLPEQFLLYIGGFDVRKNLPALFSAFAFLHLNRPPNTSSPSLVVAGPLPEGDTPFAPDPRSLATDLQITPHVHCPGLIEDEDLPALYSLATALVYPSRFEGFGLPPLEAMACGCPVIAANNTSLPEVVGDGGILLDPDDAVGLAATMQELWEDEYARKNWRRRALARATHFSWDRAAEETLAVFVRAASGGREVAK